LSEKQQQREYNIADAANYRWNHGRYQDGHNDRAPWLNDAKSFTPNAWGLYNMLGNAAEWTASEYIPRHRSAVNERQAMKLTSITLLAFCKETL